MEVVSKNNGFTFIWKIHNFSYCVKKTDEFLESPFFFVIAGKDKWSLDLYPRGTTDKPDFIAFRLWIANGLKESVNIAFSTLMGPDSKESPVCECSVPVLPESTYCSSVVSLQVPAIHKSVRRTHGNDTFTIKCKIIKVDNELLNDQTLCQAYTVISCRKTVYNWNIATFKSEKSVTENLNLLENLFFTVIVTMQEKFSDGNLFEILIKRGGKNTAHCTSCALYLIVADKVLYSIKKVYIFDASETEETWKFSFMVTKKMLSYPQADTFVSLEIAVSNDFFKGIKSIKYGSVLDINNASNSPTVSSKPTIEHLNPWKENLSQLYSDGSLSDITIQTPSKQFPVHKAMLISQSPVFKAMFEHDTKEKQTGIIPIEDLEDDIVSRMLLYIYSGSVENLDWDSAMNLYSAADKYRITGLVLQCSDFLKENLRPTNVCEFLVLADLHQDQDLKSVAQEFIMDHSSDVMDSEKWRDLMKENLNLAAETMHLFCLRNSNI